MEFTTGTIIFMISVIGAISSLVGFIVTFFVYSKQKKKLLEQIEFEE